MSLPLSWDRTKSRSLHNTETYVLEQSQARSVSFQSLEQSVQEWQLKFCSGLVVPRNFPTLNRGDERTNQLEPLFSLSMGGGASAAWLECAFRHSTALAAAPLRGPGAANSSVLGTLSDVQIKINGFSMTVEVTDRVPCADCAARLPPAPEAPQQLPGSGGSEASLSSVSPYLLKNCKVAPSAKPQQDQCTGNEKCHVQTVFCILHHSVKLLARPSSLRWSLALVPHTVMISGLHGFSLGVLPEKEHTRN
ncbi:uncharacterized protein LJ206_013427 isoform 1-T1 [Theristicus caerulescens]